MAEKKGKKVEAPLNYRDMSICDATVQMLEKGRRDGVESCFDRAASMKAWAMT